MAATRWLDDRQQHVWRSYLRMNQELYGRLTELLTAEAAMSDADYAVLVELSESPQGVVRARELGVTLGWERSRLSHHVGRMERRRLVVREECADDARGLMVRITRSGRRAIEAAAPAHAEAVQQLFFDLLSPREMQVLADVFDRVLRHLAEEEVP